MIEVIIKNITNNSVVDIIEVCNWNGAFEYVDELFENTSDETAKNFEVIIKKL